MKLCDPDLNRQLLASVDRYEQLPSWFKEASKDRCGSEASTKKSDAAVCSGEADEKDAVLL